MKAEHIISRIKLSHAHAAEVLSYLVETKQQEALIESDFDSADLHQLTLDEFDLHGSTFAEANLNKTSLRKVNLWGAQFSGTNLSYADLTEAMLLQNTFTNVNLRNSILCFARLDGSKLQNSDLSEADLSFTSLQNVELQDVTLVDTNFNKAYFSQANLRSVDLSVANLDHAQFLWSDLSDSTIRLEQLLQLTRLRGTTMPNGNRYDGRFNLRGDIEAEEALGFDTHDSSVMAQRYGVTLAEYSAGQQWASDNLSGLQSNIQ